MVSAVLADFRSRYFRKEADEEIHNHRVTLFKCEDCPEAMNPGKRLAIFARDGVHQGSGSSWALDENHPDGCRGIAGKLWFNGAAGVHTAACAWPEDGNALRKAEYATSLGITVEEAEALNVKSRVFTGMRIMARGERWGVVLLDSKKEGHIVDNGYKKGLLQQLAKLLSAMIERARI